MVCTGEGLLRVSLGTEGRGVGRTRAGAGSADFTLGTLGLLGAGREPGGLTAPGLDISPGLVVSRDLVVSPGLGRDSADPAGVDLATPEVGLEEPGLETVPAPT